MERVNDVLKTVIGILIVLFFVNAFSSCNNEQKEVKSDSEIVQEDKFENENKSKSESVKEKIKEESSEMERKLDELGKKAGEKGDKLGKKAKDKLEALNKERKEIINDSTDEKLESRWEEFKVKVNRQLDSLDKKF